MVGVADATPTLPLPYQLFVRLSLLAIPKARQKRAKSRSRHTNFEHNAPPMIRDCVHGRRRATKSGPTIAQGAALNRGRHLVEGRHMVERAVLYS